jgi:hypothetical protein
VAERFVPATIRSAAVALAIASTTVRAQARTYDPDAADQFQWQKLPDATTAYQRAPSG